MRVFVLILSLLLPQAGLAERIKDLASIAGVRENQLVGYGLVVGLPGSGDQTVQTPFTVQSLRNMLNSLGITLPPNLNLQLKNIAAVMVHATLPPFAQPGQTIDVTVSSIGNAKGLRGGALLMTPLRGADGNIYAMAQGNLVVGGFGAEGNDGSSVTVNIPTSGRIPNGATVEAPVASPFAVGDILTLQLNTPDFGTARNLMDSLNSTFGEGTALAVDGTNVRVRGPVDPAARVSFVAALQDIEVQPATAAARVIVNSRTGTVVIGSEVRISPAAISHGNLTVTVSEEITASQPGAFARAGETAILNNSSVRIEEEDNGMFLFSSGASLDDLVRAVNEVGAAPGDLVAILEALKQVGALRAELIVI
ncbi:MAG: flagellar basal body P-ring protein FlgI [Halieaceae bacterium]|nr:flagellar basal body P-ring protein FlgI [Halieaceae bacterium]